VSGVADADGGQVGGRVERDSAAGSVSAVDEEAFRGVRSAVRARGRSWRQGDALHE